MFRISRRLVAGPGSKGKPRPAMVLAVLVLLVALLAGCGARDPAPAPGEKGSPASESSAPVAQEDRDPQPSGGFPAARVTDTLDGDTLGVVLENGRREKVRLIGVDTPETSGDPQPYGPEAAAFTENSLNGRRVWLETDVEARDRYGRLLAYVWLSVPESRDEAGVRTKMFNARLLAGGYAQVLTVPPNVRYADFFVQLQKEAREAKRGLWSVPVKIERYYLGNMRSKKFHRPDCRWARQIKPENGMRFATRDAALDAGYSACRDCRP
ncbi:MAG: thermonuclease family protein [Bacillota bacterium]|nr:thermonuclease family protein [Bacillota bacterium]